MAGYGYGSAAKDGLYDLHSDPYEMFNRIDNPDRAGIIRDMRSNLRD